MENNKTVEDTHTAEEKKTSKWKSLVKKFGIGGIIFFTVKGIITSTLIYFLGKNFWTVISNYFSTLFE
ncbi:hypothetical protein B0A69_12680 [Chryseobacterium shigense]|uniref:Histidine kinase n=1 Tax=Chryseobacterium shigense TaxID=297244 RepID=A0A1N7JWE3_9FLAO|nr:MULTISPECIES: hypothetical protein [Chryseobacterium]PQA93013.1 hypothetical protein B0A69_12680 [Chryseobacterium shigense]SIS53675.1 hypothetical protein SAMN05421639_107204 [Chryseobacterium shigense]